MNCELLLILDLGGDRRSAGQMKPQSGDSVTQPERAADPVKFDQASPVDSSVPVLVAGTRNGMTTLDYPSPKPVCDTLLRR